MYFIFIILICMLFCIIFLFECFVLYKYSINYFIYPCPAVQASTCLRAKSAAPNGPSWPRPVYGAHLSNSVSYISYVYIRYSRPPPPPGRGVENENKTINK